MAQKALPLKLDWKNSSFDTAMAWLKKPEIKLKAVNWIPHI